jgi:hypothetical protein
VLRERVEVGGVRVGDQQHVRLLDLLEAADRGAVEAESVLEDAFRELGDGDGEVLGEARKVTEPQVDDLDVVLFREREDVFRRLGRRGHLRCTPCVDRLTGTSALCAGAKSSVRQEARCFPGVNSA